MNTTPTAAQFWRRISVAGLLVIAWQQTATAQSVFTQVLWRVEQPAQRASAPLPKGAHILILTNSPVTNEAQRKYDQEMAAAVQNCWLSLLKSLDAPLDFAGTNVTEFEISLDGSVKKLVCVQKSGNKVLDMTSECAIRMPAPFRHEPGRDEPRKFCVAFLLPEKKK